MIDLKLEGNALDFKAVWEEIKSEFTASLPSIAAVARQDFRDAALSESGPHSLGIRTGRLYEAFTVEVVRPDASSWGGLKPLVPEQSQAWIYGSYWDTKKGWFETGLKAMQPGVDDAFERALDRAVESVGE